MNLLIINDNIFEAQTMKEEIRWEQYGIDQVLLAYNAGEAYEIIQKGTIDIALCDIDYSDFRFIPINLLECYL